MNGFVSIKQQLFKKQRSNPSERLHALLPLMWMKQPTSSSKIKLTKIMASFLSLLKSWNRSLMTRRRRSKELLSSGENTTLNLNTRTLKSLSVDGTEWRLSSGEHLDHITHASVTELSGTSTVDPCTSWTSPSAIGWCARSSWWGCHSTSLPSENLDESYWTFVNCRKYGSCPWLWFWSMTCS